MEYIYVRPDKAVTRIMFTVQKKTFFSPFRQFSFHIISYGILLHNNKCLISHFVYNVYLSYDEILLQSEPRIPPQHTTVFRKTK